MKITDALLGEHGVLHALFDHVEALLPRLDTAAAVHAAVEIVAEALIAHARLEDDLLFPALEARIGPGGPLHVMRTEHADIEEELARARAATGRDDAVHAIRAALDTARQHFRKEEMVLFRLAAEALAPELERLGDRWAQARGVPLGGAAGGPFRIQRGG